MGSDAVNKDDYPLRRQRTVVQFNSTYMELTDRWEFNRGTMVWKQIVLSFVAIVGLGVCGLMFYEGFLPPSFRYGRSFFYLVQY